MFDSKKVFNKYAKSEYPNWESTSDQFKYNIELAWLNGCEWALDIALEHRNSQKNNVANLSTSNNTERDVISCCDDILNDNYESKTELKSIVSFIKSKLSPIS